jgi:phosphonate transport system substrate-binding protein
MHSHTVVRVFLRLLCLVAVLVSGAATSFSANALPGTVVVALKPDKNPDKMLEERGALAQSLSKILGRPVRVIVLLSATVIIEGLANGSIDLGWLSATDMVRARKADAAELLLVGEIDGKREYSSLWLCLKDKPYESLEALRGKPVAFASLTSTSGHLIPRLDLKKRGLIENNPVEFFGEGNVWFGSGYMSGVERVLSGEAEAAAVSDYVFEKDNHMTPDQKARLRILSRQGPVPTHVLAVSARLDSAARETLRDALLKFTATEAGLCDTVFTSPLVTADAETHLQPVVEALAILPEQ